MIQELEEKTVTERVTKSTMFIDLMRSMNGNLIVAGGSVLKQIMYHDLDEICDVDMYVQDIHADEALHGIHNKLKRVWPNMDIQIGLQPSYDKSFLRKNGITMMVQFKPDPYSSVEIQLMITSRPVVNVVTNFDLTCCQVWFDGYVVRGTHLEDTFNRMATLQGEYVHSLIEGNRFITRRMKKYSERGFTIKLDTSLLYTGRVKPNLDHIQGDNWQTNRSRIDHKKYTNVNWEEIAVKRLLLVTLMKNLDTAGLDKILKLYTKGLSMTNFIHIFDITEEDLLSLVFSIIEYTYEPKVSVRMTIHSIQSHVSDNIYSRIMAEYENKLGPIDIDGIPASKEVTHPNVDIPFTFNIKDYSIIVRIKHKNISIPGTKTFTVEEEERPLIDFNAKLKI